MFIFRIRTAPEASLVQREVSAEQADGGIVAVEYNVFPLSFGKIAACHCTIPQSKIKDF